MLFIIDFLKLLLLIKLATLGMQLEFNLTVFLFNDLYNLLVEGKYFLNKKRVPSLIY